MASGGDKPGESRPIFSITSEVQGVSANNHRVGEGLDLLRDGLAPYVERELKDRYGEGWILRATTTWANRPTCLDCSVLLRLMWTNWSNVFGKKLDHQELGLVSELRGIRNRWAHQGRFSDDDAYRALDAAGRLLTAISAPQATGIEKLKKGLLRLSVDGPKRNPQAYVSEVASQVVIPCRVGVMDTEFAITGLIRQSRSIELENVYAVVFNFMQRSTLIDERKDRPQFIEGQERKRHFECNYRSVFRLAMLVLAMIRCGYAREGNLSVQYDGHPDELELAVGLVNDYAQRICALAGMDYVSLKVGEWENSTSISLSSKQAEVRVVDRSEDSGGRREVWYAPRIVYSNLEGATDQLDFFLQEMSDFESFRPGQREAVAALLSRKRHSVHVMPTGSGKSLVFYLAAFLQPCPTIVICPTDLLILDQLRNLRLFHRIDDASHLASDGGHDLKWFRPSSKLIYMTPETLQNSSVLSQFLAINQERTIASVVLDEVHCISNWGHDFRPDYLMVSKYLRLYLDRTCFWGFTATADYTVVKDLCEQLGIRDEDVLTPIESNGERFSFHFCECDTEDEMFGACSAIIAEAISLRQRTLVFTKDQPTSKRLLSAMGGDTNEVDVFDPDDCTSYDYFAEGRCSVLIASGDIGIGINLPDVTNVVHLGFPGSKNSYVQEIGRAGRKGENVHSYVVSQSPNACSECPELMHRDTPIDSVFRMLDSVPETNDYVRSFRRLTHGIPHRETLFAELKRVAAVLKDIKDDGEWTCPVDESDLSKRCLYILCLCGYIFDWWVLDRSDSLVKFRVLVRRGQQELPFMKRALKDHFSSTGPFWESIRRVGSAPSFYHLLEAYVDWFYEKFLFRHRELLLDLMVFITSNQIKTSSSQHQVEFDKTVRSRLQDHFAGLRLEDVRGTARKISQTPMRDIVAFPLGSDIEAGRVETALADRYSVQLDLASFMHLLVHQGGCDLGRLGRIVRLADQHEFEDFKDALPSLYAQCPLEARFLLVQAMEKRLKDEGGFLTAIDDLFRHVSRDKIYYGIISHTLRGRFGEGLTC